MRPSYAIQAALALFTAACASSVQVESVVPPDAAPLQPGQTYAWRPGSGGVDGDLRTAGNRSLDELIKTLVDDEMSNHGYRRVEGEADLMLAYVAAVERELRVEELDELFRYRRRMYVVTRTDVEAYDVGSLVLDITDGTSGDLLWRGGAQADLHSENRDYREAKLREGVKALIAELPSGARQGS